MLKRIILICQIIFLLGGSIYFATRNLQGEEIQLLEPFSAKCKHHHAFKYKGYCEKYKVWVLIPDSPEYKLNDTIVAYKPLYPLGEHSSGSTVCFFVLSLFLACWYIAIFYDTK